MWSEGGRSMAILNSSRCKSCETIIIISLSSQFRVKIDYID